MIISTIVNKETNGYVALRQLLLPNYNSNPKTTSEGNSEVTFKNQSNSHNKSDKESSPIKEEIPNVSSIE